MKIIHTSDWHLGQNFYRYDRDDEHRQFFDQLAAIMGREQPDALVVSGDIFHNSAPAASAQTMLVHGVMKLHAASPSTVIVITAGNHDSGSRLDTHRDLWRTIDVHVMGACRRNADGTFSPGQMVVRIPGKGVVVAAPHFHVSNYPLAKPDTSRDERQRAFFEALLAEVAELDLPTVMMAHLAVEGCDTRGHEDEPVGGMLKEKLAELGEGYDYLALGHIHMPQQVSDRAYYSGSPVAVSFSEDYDHYVNVVEIAAHGSMPVVRQVAIEQVRAMRTLPPGGAPLDEALAALADLDDAADCYVRLLVDQDGLMPADAEDRARRAVQGKACRFCEVRRKPREQAHASADDLVVHEVEDFSRLEPFDIAKRSYQRSHAAPMLPELEEMMKKAIDLANQENQ